MAKEIKAVPKVRDPAKKKAPVRLRYIIKTLGEVSFRRIQKV